MKGKVTVPSRVQEHFLAYINPREAAMLRAMGGGVSKDGGQKMMNGVPFFSEADEEGGPGFDVADVTGPSASGDSPSGVEVTPLADMTPQSGLEATLGIEDRQPTEPDNTESERGGGIMSLVKNIFTKGAPSVVGDYLGVSLSPQTSGAMQALGGLGSLAMGGPGVIMGGYNLFQGLNRALDLDTTETDPFETDEQEMNMGSDN